MADRSAAKRFFKKYLLAVIAVSAVIVAIAVAVTVIALRGEDGENAVEESPRFTRTYPADERLLSISAELDDGMLSELSQGIPVLASGYDPYFEFEGEGNISVRYSYDALTLELVEVLDEESTSATDSSETLVPSKDSSSVTDAVRSRYGVRVPADVTSLMVEYGTDKAEMFAEVSGEMRSYCSFERQMIGEAYARSKSDDPEYKGPPDKLADAYRHAFTSYLFIDLTDGGGTVIAKAAVRLISKSQWVLGKDRITPSELVKADVTNLTDASHGTSVELISYWQIEKQ